MEWNEFPKSVVHFYVQLYSKKKLKANDIKIINKKDLIAEATKSWTNLNERRKQIIKTKYNCHRLKLRKQYANKLAGPLSKGRSPKEADIKTTSYLDGNGSDVCKEASQNTSRPNDSIGNNLLARNDVLDVSLQQSNEFRVISPTNGSMKVDTEDCILDPPVNTLQLQIKYPALLLEPTPPKFRSNKDFYYLINAESKDVPKWEDITRGEKGHYERAATHIRRNYLTSYTNFLESLTLTELSAYYTNVTNNN
ncbi:unnamed protein product [Leptosia nina]|uniref:HMG box domain-containing protein n=1 Tax=Leptosia nina TaxID=320188 RepID=A0AAV1IUG9_9NEOP